MRFNTKKFLKERGCYTSDMYKSGVYKITFTNSESGRVYIGSTTISFLRRFGRHINDLRKKTKRHIKLQHAYTKYGEENIHFEILEICEENHTIRETFYINKYDSYNNGYNCTKRGDNTLGFKMYEHVIEKTRVPILQYDLEGNFIREWCSYSEIWRTLGGFANYSKVLISSNYSANDSMWRYKTENYPLKIEPYLNLTKKKIYQYDLDGNFIKEWESILEASNSLNIPVGNITKTVQGKYKICYGFYFYDKPVELGLYERHHPFEKGLIVTDLVTNEVFKFKGKREAAKALNINRSGLRNALLKNNGLMIKRKLKIEEV